MQNLLPLFNTYFRGERLVACVFKLLDAGVGAPWVRGKPIDCFAERLAQSCAVEVWKLAATVHKGS